MEIAKRNILLVEDEKITALFENRWLTDEGYNVIHTVSGDEAVRIMKSGTVPVDLVLMDIELGPDSIDGIKAAGEILKHHDVPLLFISSHTESEIVERTEHLTSYGYITKGSGYAVLLASIKMAFQLHKVNQKLKQQQESLKDREFWLNESQRVARIGHYNVNIKTGVWTSSPMLDELMGFDDKYKKNVSSWINTVHPDDRDKVWEYRQSVLREKKQFDQEYRVVRPADGSVLWVHEVGNLSFDIFGEPESMFGTVQDITKRRKYEEALKENEKFMKTVVDAMPDIVCFKDGKGRWLLANHFDLKLFRLEGVDYFGKTDLQLAEYSPFFSEAFGQCEETDEQAWQAGLISRRDEIIPIPEGGTKIFDILKVPLFSDDGSRKGLIVIGRDITERKQIESALIESLKEKEILLKEIHHRVKNNLQIISSLLSLQNDSISLENFRKSINDSRTRIRTMAMIHEKLYRTSNFSNLQFDEYVSDLINYLYHTYGSKEGRIEIKEEYEKVVLPLDMAIPMALIINELVSNVFKYAFPGEAAGCLRVSMDLNGEQLLLRVKDNGVGLPDGADLTNTATLGLVMVQNLTQQLKGTLEMISGNGLECIIRVPVKDPPVQ